jgi:hypothetical protein
MHKYLFAAAALTLSSPALATIAVPTVTSSIYTNNSGAPTYNRVSEPGFQLSSIGTAVHYQSYAFNVSTSGSYTLNVSAPPTNQFFDTFLVLYQDSFNPSSALTNLVQVNDDFNGALYISQITQALTVGTNYIAVVSGYGNNDVGDYTITFSGPGSTSFNPIVAAAPEPATWGMMIVGFGLAGASLRRRRRGASNLRLA